MTLTKWLIAALVLLLSVPLVAQDEALAPDTENANDGGMETQCDTDAHLRLDDDPDSPGGDRCAATDNNTDWNVMFTMPTPASALDNTTDAQAIDYYVQSFDEGQGLDPTIRVDIYDTTSTACDTLHETGSETTLTDAGFPAKVTDNWTSAGLSSAADVCVNIVCTKTGGSPGNRNSCNIDAIEWDVTWSAVTDDSLMVVEIPPEEVNAR